MRDGFVIHHNGPNTGLTVDDDHAACVAFWNGVKRYHVEGKGWSDIAYSFGECPHGIRFVGRGWDRAQFANGEDVVGAEDGSDAHWYTVLVFLGWNADASNPVDEQPSAQMVAGVRQLIAEGRDSGRCGLRVLPHNAFKVKRCPGEWFTEFAAAWDGKPFALPVPPPLAEEADELMAHVIDITDRDTFAFMFPDGKVVDGLTRGQAGACQAVYVFKSATQTEVNIAQAVFNGTPIPVDDVDD